MKIKKPYSKPFGIGLRKVNGLETKENPGNVDLAVYHNALEQSPKRLAKKMKLKLKFRTSNR